MEAYLGRTFLLSTLSGSGYSPRHRVLSAEDCEFVGLSWPWNFLPLSDRGASLLPSPQSEELQARACMVLC